MIVTRGISTDRQRELLDPLLERKWSIYFELRGGDILDPVQIGGNNWFKPPYPKRIWRAFCRWNILPFLAWRFNTRGGYVGFKAYSADGNEYPAYREWMPAEDIGPGSRALCFSARPFADMVKQ